jgi:RNA polymerase sigma-70 factor (ECF subfamily)
VQQADEAQLLRRIARGDRAAFDELYRRTSPWLAVRLRRRCADDDLVAEVMQETYLAVWRAAAAFTGIKGSAVGWLWTIAARRLVAAAWLLDREPPPPADPADPFLLQQSETLSPYQALRELPPDEQRARVAALRGAELACGPGDRLELLIGPSR